ncbi:hypothetical protein [Comamonas sp.]|uniref:hypothetical protein n=1 Tax=Comamonas sp. TaxID=34028 RepID=UPI003A92DDAC
MKQELIGPTAALAVALLSKVESKHTDFTRDIVASAFEDAYLMLLEGISRVDQAIADNPELGEVDLD